MVRVVAADTKSKTLERNPNVLNNAMVFHRKTAGPALDNRILSDDLEVNVKSDSPAAALSDKLESSKRDNGSERLLPNLDASKLDGSTERLDDKATAEKKAHGKTPAEGHSKAKGPGDSVSDEHAAKLKAEAEAIRGAPKGSSDKTPSQLTSVASERSAKLKAEAEWIGEKNSSDSPVAGAQKIISISHEHTAKLKAEANSKP